MALQANWMWLVEAGDLTEGNNVFLVFAFFFARLAWALVSCQTLVQT